jgi:hypothetical protein
VLPVLTLSFSHGYRRRIGSTNIVAYLLKVKLWSQRRHPLLANGSETTFVSRQRPRNRQLNDVRCEAADT